MGELRSKMISTLRLENYSEKTIYSYTKQVSRFAKHFNKCPSRLGGSEIREYLIEMLNRDLSDSQYRQAVAALRCLYVKVLALPWMDHQIPHPRSKPRKIPVVLTVDEVARFLKNSSNLKELAIISTLYGTGLRVRELQGIKIKNVDSKNMLIFIECGKGRKQRYVPLPQSLLILLRNYYKEYKPVEYLFQGRSAGCMGIATIQKICKRAGYRARIQKTVLGHSQLSTTEIYTHVSTKRVQKVKSPLDILI